MDQSRPDVRRDEEAECHWRLARQCITDTRP